MGLFIEFPLCDIRYYPNPPFFPGFFWEYEWWNIEVSFHQGMILFETSHKMWVNEQKPWGHNNSTGCLHNWSFGWKNRLASNLHSFSYEIGSLEGDSRILTV